MFTQAEPHKVLGESAPLLHTHLTLSVISGDPLGSHGVPRQRNWVPKKVNGPVPGIQVDANRGLDSVPRPQWVLNRSPWVLLWELEPALGLRGDPCQVLLLSGAWFPHLQHKRCDPRGLLGPLVV